MEKETLRETLIKLFLETPGNVLPAELSVDEAVRGLRLFDAPLIGFGSADDPLFEQYHKPAIIGPWYRAPKEWFPEAATVLSFFFPFSEEVRSSNRKETEHCSLAWAYGRIEGQEVQNAYMKQVLLYFEEKHIPAFVPGLSPEFQSFRGMSASVPESGIIVPNGVYSSNWSERHAAYVCGLGTFSLSKGLITKKGMAGRFSSILIADKYPADPRPYTGVYDYCIRCGKCAKRCPFKAIRLENGKDHSLCAPYRKRSEEFYAPRFGCGLCQTRVPCEFKNPSAP